MPVLYEKLVSGSGVEEVCATVTVSAHLNCRFVFKFKQCVSKSICLPAVAVRHQSADQIRYLRREPVSAGCSETLYRIEETST